MAHAEFTGYSGGTEVLYDAETVPTGWRKITIAEKGKSLAEPLDKTHAGDATYVFMDDPLGAKGQASATVTIEGFLSSTDHQDTGILASTVDAALTLIVTTKALGDRFTLSSAVYKGIQTGAAFAAVQPYTATFSKASAAGAWSTAV